MKRKKKKNTELIIGSSLSVMIMLLIYTSFSWSSYTKLSQLKDIRKNIKITGASIVSDEEFYSQLEILNGVEHANFFEARATEYSKVATSGNWDGKEGVWSTFDKKLKSFG